VLQHVGEAEVRHAAAQNEIAVDVADALPRVDRRQVRRALGCGEPLRNRQIRGPAHRNLARAPVLLGQPLDQVMAILALLAVPHDAVTAGFADAAGISVADRVALRAPVRRVGTLKLLQTGHDAVVQANQVEDAGHAGRGALTLAVRAPRDDHRDLFSPDRAEDVNIDRHPVPEPHRDVLVQNDI